jgi:predicted transcriptional regulator
MADNVYKAVLNPLSTADIRFLKAMAQDDGPSRIGDIQKHMGESQAYTQVYRRRLLESGTVASEQRGELNFTMPFMAEYLRTGL